MPWEESIRSEAAGGRVDKYIGDGLMAVFEHPSGLPGAARAAVEAVVAIEDALGGVNQIGGGGRPCRQIYRRRADGRVRTPQRPARRGPRGGRGGGRHRGCPGRSQSDRRRRAAVSTNISATG